MKESFSLQAMAQFMNFREHPIHFFANAVF